MSLILKEALLIGLLGGIAGIGTALLMIFMLQQVPMIGSYLTPIWEWDVVCARPRHHFDARLIGWLVPGIPGNAFAARRST